MGLRLQIEQEKALEKMRPTLHDYVIEQFNTPPHQTHKTIALNCLKYAKLTNRAPRLGDFVPCDEDGNILEKPERVNYEIGVDGFDRFKEDYEQYQQAQSRVIFKGGWEVVHSEYDYAIIRSKEFQFIWKNGKLHYCQDEINRIEDLPREIEFKEGLI